MDLPRAPLSQRKPVLRCEAPEPRLLSDPPREKTATAAMAAPRRGTGPARSGGSRQTWFGLQSVDEMNCLGKERGEPRSVRTRVLTDLGSLARRGKAHGVARREERC